MRLQGILEHNMRHAFTGKGIAMSDETEDAIESASPIQDDSLLASVDAASWIVNKLCDTLEKLHKIDRVQSLIMAKYIIDVKLMEIQDA